MLLSVGFGDLWGRNNANSSFNHHRTMSTWRKDECAHLPHVSRILKLEVLGKRCGEFSSEKSFFSLCKSTLNWFRFEAAPLWGARAYFKTFVCSAQWTVFQSVGHFFWCHRPGNHPGGVYFCSTWSQSRLRASNKKTFFVMKIRRGRTPTWESDSCNENAFT